MIQILRVNEPNDDSVWSVVGVYETLPADLESLVKTEAVNEYLAASKDENNEASCYSFDDFLAKWLDKRGIKSLPFICKNLEV